MHGWVYVITNAGMPGFIKIGHTTKDPERRARAFGTGSPHRYLVQYVMRIEDPARVERRAHEALQHLREGREWFRCSCEEGIAAIQIVSKGKALDEEFRGADRARAELIRRERVAHEAYQQRIRSRLAEQELSVGFRYDRLLSERFRQYPFWQYWIGCGAFLLFIISLMFPLMSVAATAFWMGAGGLVVAAAAKRGVESWQAQSEEYQALRKEKAAALEAARTTMVIPCPNPQCRQGLRLSTPKLMAKGRWRCPSCRRAFEPLGQQ